MGAAATAGVLARNASATDDVNSKIRAAVIGVYGRGKTHIKGFQAAPGTEVVALCDPDEEWLGKRAHDFEQQYGRKVDTVKDMRTLFDRDDIDVVGIATPNHWHTLATIWACEAGKDVYCEKPGSHNLFEGRQLIAAAKKYNRIVQHGVQLRSNPELQRAVQLLREGVIGEVYMARSLVFKRRASIGKKPAEAPPAHLDWNLWQGPAQERPFSKNIVHYNWHWQWEYGNGDIGNQGVHENDMAYWGLNATVDGELGLPTDIGAMGGKYLWDDDRATPELLSSSLIYPEQKKMIQVEVRPWLSNREQNVKVGNFFYGTQGYMVITAYNKFETYLGEQAEPGPKGSSGNPNQAHFDNFIAAVRARDTSVLNAPVETAHLSSGLAHLANTSYQLQRRLKFDPATETFPGDREADALSTREYRAPFVVPKLV